MGTSLEMLPAGTEQLSSEEEGEIIELDDDDNEFDYRSPANAPATAAIDFEDISSDEELNLRQRIEELEARNQELEQIAAITKAADDFAAPSSRITAAADLEFIDLVAGDSSPDRPQNPRHHRHHSQQHYQYHVQYCEHSNNTHHQTRHRKPGTAVVPPTRRSSASDTIGSGHRSRQHSSRQRHTVAHRTTAHRHHADAPMDGASSRSDNADSKRHKRRRRSLDLCPNDAVVDQHQPQKTSRSDRTERPDHRLSYTAAREARTQQQRHPHPQRQREPHRKPGAHRHNRLRTRSRSSSASSSASNSSSSSSSSSTSSSSSASSANSISAALHGTPYRPHRNVLRAAVKREPVGSGASMARQPLSPATSSLQRKLMGIQQSVTQYIADGVADIVEETEVTASIEIMQLLNTLTDERIIDVQSDESKRSGDNKATVISEENSKSQPQLEAISLEEQELRLVALKSAILKKHEARKRRKVLEARPYSPTDTDIVLDSHGPTANRVTDSIMIDLINDSSNADEDAHEEPLNMEISPAHSPSSMMTPWLLNGDAIDQTGAVADKILQPVDMELSDGSISPEYPLNEEDEMEDATSAPLTPTQWIPLPPDDCLTGATTPPDDIRSFSIFQQQQQLEIPPPPPPLDQTVMAAAKLATSMQRIEETASLPFDDEEEAALRALLLSTKAKRKPVAAAVAAVSVPVVAPVMDRHVKTADDDDADHLRSIAMQSLAKRAQQPSQQAQTTTVYDVSQKENNNHETAAKQATPTSILIKTIPNNILIDTNRQPVANLTSVSAPESTDRTCRNLPSSSVLTIVPTNIVAPVQPHVVSPTKVAAIALKRKAIAIANVARKRAATETSPVGPALPKSSSALITHMNVKPVRPLIIRVTHASDSDSDEWAAATGGFDHGGGGSNADTLDRFFDPASPASCFMDPAVADDGGSSNSNGPMPAAGRCRPMFEQKVDEYLRMVRRKIQHSQPVSPATTPDGKTEVDASTVKTTAGGAPPSATLLPAQTKPTKMMVTTKTGPATPLVVRHLPLSSQAEYKQLVLRMSMLEQKRAKQQQKQPAKPTPGREQPIGGPTKPTVVASSLIKRVLLKNGTDAMAGQTAAIEPPIPEPDHPINIDQDKSGESKTPVVPDARVRAVEVTPEDADGEAAKIADIATEQLLRATETRYQTQSQHLRAGLQQQHQRLVHAIKVRTKQLLLERQRKRLQQQLQRVERDLMAERTAYKELCPRIVAAHQEMRAERSECVQLADRCATLARLAGGDDATVVYTVPNEAMAQIELGFVQIHEQTQRLKALRTDTVLTPPARPPAQLPTSTHVEPSDSGVIKTAPLATPEEPVVAPISQTADDPVLAVADQQQAAGVFSSRDDGVGAAVGEQPLSPPPTIAEPTTAADDVAEVSNAPLSINKYQSPLDHISTHSSSVNPDVVLCPFELQGRCDDRECAYQHLSVARD